jgi:integrase/recombinase XerD
MAKRARHNERDVPVIEEPYRAYLLHLQSLKRSPNTLKAYGFVFGRLHRFLSEQSKQLRELTEADVEAFRLRMLNDRLCPATVERCMASTRHFFRWMEDTGQVFLNPTATLIVKRPTRPILYAPSEEEMKKLLAQPNVSTPIGLRDRAFIETAYSTGARLEELTNLTIFDPDLDRGTVRVLGKGKKERVVPLGRQAVYWLKQYLKHARPKMLKQRLDLKALWIGAYGEAVDAPGLRAAVGVLSRRAGLRRISPHAIRRACATHMLRNGAHPVQIQFLLGHAGLNTLSQYLRVSVTDMRKTHRASKPGN